MLESRGWRAAVAALADRPAARVAQRDLAIDVQVVEYAGDRERGTHRKNVRRSDPASGERGVDGLLDLPLRRHPEPLEELSHFEIEDLLIHDILPASSIHR